MKLWSFMGTSGWDSHRTLAANEAEARWLLSVAAGMGATHVAIITELDGTTPAVIAWLVAEIRSLGMREVLWTSKGFTLPWRQAEGLAYVRQLARDYPDALFDIGREADFLWQVHAHPEAEIVAALWQLKMALIGEGIPAENIMAGGHTLEGAAAIDRIGPGWVSVTGYAWVDLAWRRYGAEWQRHLADVVREQLITLRGQTDPQHRICVAEVGWHDLESEHTQQVIMRETLRGARESGVVDGVGFWTLVDFVHCGDTAGNSAGVPRCEEGARRFGLLDGDGAAKPAYWEMVQEWR